jgi:hypothetical protein
MSGPSRAQHGHCCISRTCVENQNLLTRCGLTWGLDPEFNCPQDYRVPFIRARMGESGLANVVRSLIVVPRPVCVDLFVCNDGSRAKGAGVSFGTSNRSM